MTHDALQPETRSQSVQLLCAVAIVFALFHWSAEALGSDRGQYGIAIAMLVVVATLASECAIYRVPVTTAVRSIGLIGPTRLAMVVAASICILLLSIPVLMRITGLQVNLAPGWLASAPGLFAQAGIAEETLFRGFLFGHLRRGRSFWRAALLSMPPFLAVHMLMFLTMPWPIAAAAVLLSVVISFPLARLFDLGGSSIWPPALVHAVVQGSVKVVAVPESGAWFAIVWMAASAVLPMLVFLIRDRHPVSSITPARDK